MVKSLRQSESGRDFAESKQNFDKGNEDKHGRFKEDRHIYSQCIKTG